MTSTASHPHGTVCVACGSPVLTGTEKPEHPIQAAIGSSWEVFTFCDDCNRWASKEIDQPFLNEDLILELRSRYDVRDVRHSGRARRIPSPFLRGYTEDGFYVVADDQGNPHLRSSRIEQGEDGEFFITAGSEEEMERLLNDLRLTAALDGKTVDTGESILVEDRPMITGRVTVRPWVLRRAIAKIALAAGSVAYDESWRLSDDAERLRRWMRDKHALPLGHCPFEQVKGSLLEELVEPPHHAMFFRRRESATILTIVLFGDIAFKVPIDTGGRALPRIAWFLDPRRPRGNGQTTWTQLLTNVLRYRFPEEFSGGGA